MNNQIDDIHSEIKTKIEFMKRYYRQALSDGSIDLVNMKVSENTQGDLYKSGKELVVLMNREAKARAYANRTDEV